MERYRRKVFYGTLTIFVFSIIAAVFAYFFRVLLTKNLSLSDYGLFYALIAFGSFLMVIRDLGVMYSGYYFIPRLISQRKFGIMNSMIKYMVKFEVLVSLMLSLALILVSDLIIQNYFHTASRAVFLIFAVLIFFNSLEVSIQHFFNFFQNQFLFSLHSLMRNVLILIITVIAFVYFNGILVPLFTHIITYALLLAIFSFVFYKKIFLKYSSHKDQKFDKRQLIIIGITSMLFSLGLFLITSADTIILTLFRTLDEVGLYNIGAPIVGLLLFFSYAASSVVLPLSSELWARKKIELLQRIILILQKYTFIILIPCVGILMMFSKYVITVLFGQEFVAASNVLFILSFGSLFLSVGVINVHFLFGVYGSREATKVYVYSAIINIISSIVLVHYLGIIGAAIGTLAGYIALYVISSFKLYEKLGVGFPWKTNLLTLLSFIVYIALLYGASNIFLLYTLLSKLLTVAISGSLYTLVLFSLKIISWDELKDIYLLMIKRDVKKM